MRPDEGVAMVALFFNVPLNLKSFNGGADQPIVVNRLKEVAWVTVVLNQSISQLCLEAC